MEVDSSHLVSCCNDFAGCTSATAGASAGASATAATAGAAGAATAGATNCSTGCLCNASKIFEYVWVLIGCAVS